LVLNKKKDTSFSPPDGYLMAKVDIAVPCYRYARFLPACIRSIQEQSLEDWRVLIIDDASPDETAPVARALAGADSRIQVSTHAVNRGHIATFNEGIDWAQADYFLLISADDLLAPGALERAVAVMEKHPEVGLTYGASPEFAEDIPAPASEQIAGSTGWEVRAGTELVREICQSATVPIATASAIVRTSAQKSVGHYRAELTHTSDMEMWLRFAAHSAVAWTPQIQAYRRLHPASMSSEVYRTVITDYLQRKLSFELFFRGAGATLADAPALQRTANRRLADQAFWSAVAQFCRGNRKGADDLIRFVWKLRPQTFMLPPIGHLFRIGNPAQKIRAVLSGTR
jgi:glycosyltransferase involved in cell wall biosynthesis